MSWKKVKLGELLEEFSVRAKNDGGAKNLEFFGVSNEDGITISKYAAEEKAENYKIIKKGCFAYNPYRINVGSIAYLDEDVRGLISPAYVVFKTKPKSIIPELLLKFLKSFEGLRQIKFYGRGTVRQALRFEDLCNIELSIPSFDEQKFFYEKIKSVDNEGNRLFKELDKQLDYVKQLRQAFLIEAMQGKLVPQNPNDEPASEYMKKIKNEKLKLKNGKKEKPLSEIKPEEIPFKIPKSWVWCRLGKIIISMTNGIYKEDKYYNSDGVGCFRMYNIKDGKINYDNIKRMILSEGEINTYALKENDLLLNRVNSIELLGKSALITKLDEPFVFESKNIRVRLAFKEKTAPFINYLFQTSIVKNQIHKSFTKVTGQASISQEKLFPIIIPLPPLPEQKRIVSKLEELMKFCDELEQSIKQSKEQTEKLLQTVLREALKNES